MSNHFTIFIPSYKCSEWVDKNINSVLEQTYQNFDIVYVDDFSPDDTYERAVKYSNDRVKVHKNRFNKGKMCNMYEHITTMNEDTIVVILDGDDWLYDNSVLQTLNETYTDDVWMTNGSYVISPSSQVVRPRLYPEYWNGNIRQKSWEFSHLGTFRKKLFSKIKRKHMMTRLGSFWHTTSDQAIMWPMAEMSGPEHHRVINDTLYVYNRQNPLSDDRVNRRDQLNTESMIRSFKPYERLQTL